MNLMQTDRGKGVKSVCEGVISKMDCGISAHEGGGEGTRRVRHDGKVVVAMDCRPRWD